MSADMMVICKEDDSGFEGKGYEKAFHIDETSMGDSHNGFGNWFVERYCGAPDMFRQLAGDRSHSFTELTQADVTGIKEALKTMTCHEGLDKDEFIKYIESHVGKHISTENW